MVIVHKWPNLVQSLNTRVYKSLIFIIPGQSICKSYKIVVCTPVHYYYTIYADIRRRARATAESSFSSVGVQCSIKIN